jgi:hypothetical protein
MPKCKNDKTRSYTGNEPSPKGRGYCAHAEEVGKRRKGKDGQFWVVKETKRGKRWFKVSKSVRSPGRQKKNSLKSSAKGQGFSMQSGDSDLTPYEKNNIDNLMTKKMFDDESLRKAVQAYKEDPETTIMVYGPLDKWDISRVNPRLQKGFQKRYLNK